MANNIIMFLFGGITYGLIEVIWRGHTHWSMAVAGGICFLLIGRLNLWLRGKVSYLTRCIFGAIAVTAVELAAGVILNLWLGLGVWDYSAMPFNLWGQICLPYFLLWVGLMVIAVWLEQAIRFKLCAEIYEK